MRTGHELDAAGLFDFIDKAPMPLHWVGPDGSILWANRAELELLGYAEHEYVGRNVAEFHVDAHVIADILDRLARGETLASCPSRLRCRDGTIKDVLISSNARFDDGEFVHSRCVTVDVTGRARAEETQALFAAIVAASDDAIVSKDLDGVVRSWNQAAERLFGYTAAEAIGRPITLIIPPELQAEEQQILAKLRRGEQISRFETVRVTKDGRRIEISLTISPVRDAEGRIIGASKIARDITERRRAEQALRASEERFRAIVESQTEMICRFRIDGTLLFVNGAYARVLGATPEALEHRNFWEFVAEADRAEVRRMLDGLTPESPQVRIENRLETARGERWTLWTNRALTFDDAGRVLEAQSAGIDITDRKRAEQALLEADRRKNEFLATLGHELRNPLTPIRNMLEVLKRHERDAELDDRAHAMMSRQLDVLARLVDDLLDVSRITHGKLELRKKRVDVSTIVRNAVEDTRELIDGAGQHLRVEVPSEPIFLEADEIRMTQVLSNLLGNASKYTPDGGRIELVVERAEREIMISVRDDGVGIPGDRLETIFAMFAQVDTPMVRGQRGLGIGLSLVKWLVELHGGRIEARSAGPGQGSEFTVHLPPAAGAPGRPVRVAPGAATPLVPRRVLVVDDNADAAHSLALLAEALGHEVRLAYDGFEAVDVAGAFRPHVVLLDIGLPGQNGYDVARQLRRQPWGADVVLAAVTGWGQEADRELALEAGCDVHVTKPMTLPAFNAVLDEIPADDEAVAGADSASTDQPASPIG